MDGIFQVSRQQKKKLVIFTWLFLSKNHPRIKRNRNTSSMEISVILTTTKEDRKQKEQEMAAPIGDEATYAWCRDSS